jgi:hypothetical protein
MAHNANALTSSISPANLFKIGGTQIVPNFPSWSVNIPLSPPTNFAAASSTSPGGSLATSTAPIYFTVAATNGTGTTTVSSELSTTTKTGSSQIHFSWTAVPGASAYFVYFSTTTPGAENAYFKATTTTAYDFTSTSSPSFGTPPGFPSSFAVQAGNGATPLTINGLSFSPIATTTGAIGGSALTAGQCATATSTLSVGTVSSSTVVITTPQKFPGPSVTWQSYVLGPTQIVTQVCTLLAGTPVSTLYNVRAF